MKLTKRSAGLFFLLLLSMRGANAQAPPPAPPSTGQAHLPAFSVMKACGDYFFILQGPVLYRLNPITYQSAGSISFEETQDQRGPKPTGMLIPAGGSGKPEALLVLLANRLFVINPAAFNKPKPIILPAPQRPGQRATKGTGGGDKESGQQPPPEGPDGPPMPPNESANPASGPAFGPDSEPQPPAGGRPAMGPMPPPHMRGRSFGRGFEPGAGPFGSYAMLPPFPPMPQVEIKGQRLFILQHGKLLTIDYQTGDVKTIPLQDLAKAEK
jgi:hypothetical protein